MIAREENTPAVVKPLAGFTLDLGIVDQVFRATTTDASGPVCPIFIVILAEGQFGSLALSILGLSGLGGEEPVQPCEIESIRDILRVPNHKLEFVELAHIVFDSR